MDYAPQAVIKDLLVQIEEANSHPKVLKPSQSVSKLALYAKYGHFLEGGLRIHSRRAAALLNLFYQLLVLL